MSTPISSQIGPMMNNDPRGLQNGVPKGSGAGGGGGVRIGAGMSAEMKLSNGLPCRSTIRTLPVPVGVMNQVWHPFMFHSMF